MEIKVTMIAAMSVRELQLVWFFLLKTMVNNVCGNYQRFMEDKAK